MADRAGPHIFVATLVALAVGVGPAALPAFAQSNPPAEGAQPNAVDAEFWDKVKDSDDPLLLEMYIRAFPTGAFVPIAHARIKALRAGADTGAKPAPPPAGAAGATAPEAKPAAAYRPGEGGWLGAEIRGVNLAGETARAGGQSAAVEVVSLVRPGPAEKAGLREGDLILAVNGAAASGTASFVQAVRDLAPGSVVDFKLLRDGARVDLPVAIGGRFTDGLIAAEAGNATAQAQIGNAYAEGEGVEKDPVLARAWHLKAAEQGQANSQVVVGYYYAQGIGGPRDDGEAVEWYRKAAAADNPMALNNLGAMYSEGRGGLAKDRASAIDLFRRAAALGNELAADNLKNMKELPYDLADIQRALADLGHDPGPVDGKMGGKTRAAIRAAQRQLRLSVDGEPSLELLIALRGAQRAAAATTPSMPAPAPSGARPGPGNLGDLDSLE